MNQLYTTDSRPKRKSTGWIIAGAAVVLIGAAAIYGNNLSGTRKSPVAELSDKLSEDRNVLRIDMVLHDRFRKLQQLDEQYTMMLMNNPNRAQLDSADYAIVVAENQMKTSLDSIGGASSGFNKWANVVMLDSITVAFKTALNNRKYLATVRSAIEGKPIEIKKSDKDAIQSQFELQKKDERIAQLEKELKAKTLTSATQSTSAAPETGALAQNSAATTATKLSPVQKAELEKKNEALEAELKTEETRSTNLLDVNRSLKSDNDRLSADLAKYKSAPLADNSAETIARNKITSLQRQIDALNADINFASIDCNLTRADAKKIISNSRQRKELLAEALKSLQGLAQSDNAETQRKAKEKLGELNQIASMVRD